MASDRVVITGANGFIGLAIVINALRAGYQVLAVVRSQEKADNVLSNPAIKALDPGSQLGFSLVPDFTKDGAYDEALKGATCAIHVASPLPRGQSLEKGYEEMIEPAVKATLNMLESASKIPDFKRVVITSSVAAQATFEQTHVDETGEIFNEKSRTPNHNGPYTHIMELYFASKAAALNASEDWMQKRNPHFSVVKIHPSLVGGRDETVTSVEEFMKLSTSRLMLCPIVGMDVPFKMGGNAISVDDVARAHVRALDEDIPDGQSILLTTGGLEGVKWNDAKEIAARRFSEALKSGKLTNGGNVPTKHTMYDYSESEKLLGWTFKDFEQQVVDVVDRYLELLGDRAPPTYTGSIV